jgi:hypothetical protein
MLFNSIIPQQSEKPSTDLTPALSPSTSGVNLSPQSLQQQQMHKFNLNLAQNQMYNAALQSAALLHYHLQQQQQPQTPVFGPDISNQQHQFNEKLLAELFNNRNMLNNANAYQLLMQKAFTNQRLDYQQLLRLNSPDLKSEDEFIPGKHKNRSPSFEPCKKFKSEHNNEANKLNSPASSTSSSSSSKFSSSACSPSYPTRNSLLQTAGEEERAKTLSKQQAKRPVLKFSMDAILGNNSSGNELAHSSNSSTNSSDYSYQSSPNSTPTKKLQIQSSETDNKASTQNPATYRIQLNYNYMDGPGYNGFKSAEAPMSSSMLGKNSQPYQSQSVGGSHSAPMYQIG